MRYVEAQIQEYKRDLTYRIFVTESLKNVAQNKYIQKTYLEVLEELDKPIEKRSAEQIMIDVMNSAGLRFG